MIVVADTEPVLDQVADHGAGPDARLVAGRDRTALDQNRQRRAPQLRQLRRRSFGDCRPQALDVVGVVPLQPAIHRPTRDSAVGGNLDDAPSVDIRPDGATAPPLSQVILELRLQDEFVELLLAALAGGANAGSRVLSWFSPRSRHDDPLAIRRQAWISDRATCLTDPRAQKRRAASLRLDSSGSPPASRRMESASCARAQLRQAEPTTAGSHKGSRVRVRDVSRKSRKEALYAPMNLQPDSGLALRRRRYWLCRRR